MKKFLVFVLCCLSTTVIYAQNGVAINTTGASPDASAVLDVSSTTQGMLVPRMAKAQRDAIATPATGLLIYQTDNTAGFYYYDGSAWVSQGAKEVNDLSDGKTSGYATAVPSIYLGQFAGANANSIYNTAVGGAALAKNTGTLISTDGHNTAIGYRAGADITTGGFNIMLGYNTQPSAITASNELNIGEAIYGTNLYGTNANIGLGNGNNAPNSTLDIAGSVSYDYASGGAITLDDKHYTYNITTANQTVTLPTAVGITGRVYIIKYSASLGSGLVLPAAGELIDGAGNYNLTAQYKYVQVQSDGTNWIIIGQN